MLSTCVQRMHLSSATAIRKFVKQSSTCQTAQCLWGARIELFRRMRGLWTENFLSDPLLVGAAKERRPGQCLSSASVNLWFRQSVKQIRTRRLRELFTPPGLAQVLALVLSWHMGFLGGYPCLEWRGGHRKVVAVWTWTRQARLGLSFPSPQGNSQPFYYWNVCFS